MPNFLDRVPRARLLVPFTLILALALAFAADAGAEVRSGESSTQFPTGALPQEATVVKAAGSYDSSTGAISVAITTQAEPLPQIEGKPNPMSDQALLLNATAGCSLDTLITNAFVPPMLAIGGTYGESVGHAAFGTPPSGPEPLGSIETFEAEKTVAGATTTFGLTAAQIANQAFNCVVVEVSNLPSEKELKEAAEQGKQLMTATSFAIFPLNGPPPTPAQQVSTPAPAAPAKLTVAKAKPLTLKAGKSKVLRVKFTNTGGTATGLGSVRAKAPAGFVLKPAQQKLPVLLPGQSWTVSFHVQATAKAKSKATITVTGTAPGISDKRSFVVKALGG